MLTRSHALPPYRLHIRPRRRTLAIQVRAAQVEVLAPTGTPQALIDAFVLRKRAWIQAKLQQQQIRLAQQPQYQYREGERFALRGRDYGLRIAYGPRAAVWRESENIWVQIRRHRGRPTAEAVRRALWRWYQQQAQQLLSERSHSLAKRLGVSLSEVRVRRTRSKWGHCTRAGVIQYNWEILQAPDPIIDYLVAHEVCHLIHPNHGPAYWALVAELVPNYDAPRRWLHQQGHRLHLNRPE